MKGATTLPPAPWYRFWSGRPESSGHATGATASDVATARYHGSSSAMAEKGTRGRFEIADGTLEALKWGALVLMVFDHVNQYLYAEGLPAIFQLGRAPLDIEITEGVLMEKTDEVIQTLSRIRQMGVCVAIDDFGTGYSSLRYLARLPIDTLKIDRSFVMAMTENADDMAIVSSIISLAHGLDLNVAARGELGFT